MWRKLVALGRKGHLHCVKGTAACVLIIIHHHAYWILLSTFVLWTKNGSTMTPKETSECSACLRTMYCCLQTPHGDE